MKKAEAIIKDLDKEIEIIRKNQRVISSLNVGGTYRIKHKAYNYDPTIRKANTIVTESVCKIVGFNTKSLRVHTLAATNMTEYLKYQMRNDEKRGPRKGAGFFAQSINYNELIDEGTSLFDIKDAALFAGADYLSPYLRKLAFGS